MTIAAIDHVADAKTPKVVIDPPSSTPTDGRVIRHRNPTSVLPPRPDIADQAAHVGFVPIVLQKSFWGGERNFLGPLMRFVRRDVRDLIAHQKNGHGASYRRY